MDEIQAETDGIVVEVVQSVVTDVRKQIEDGGVRNELADVMRYIDAQWAPKFPEVAEALAPLSLDDVRVRVIQELGLDPG